MATIRQTTRCDGKARFRSSPALALPIACSIAVHGIAVSKAFSTVLVRWYAVSGRIL
jgi:hypothetical protein